MTPRRVRLSLMLVARPDAAPGFEPAFRSLCASFAPSLAGAGGTYRFGLRDPRDPLADVSEEAIHARIPPAHAAIECTTASDASGTLDALVRELGSGLGPTVDLDASAVTVGDVHEILEPRPGASFLSFAFRRDPAISIGEFRAWWVGQHAKVATRLLGPELLAYDQVHVDRALSERLSASAGIAFHPYDAYDNLTWASVDQFLSSVSRPGGREEMYNDEIGYIDHSSYRGSLMAVVGEGT